MEDRYDLLTAALIGAAVGATATLLIRSSGPRRVVKAAVPLAKMAAVRGGRMAYDAGLDAVEGSGRMARRAAKIAGPALESAGEHVADYMSAAREAIDDVVSAELRSLRKAIRRQRRRAGL